MNEWDIPSFYPDRLATTISTCVYGGSGISDPAHTLFIWRTARLSTATGMTVGFYCGTRS